MTAHEAECLQFLRIYAYEIYIAILFAPAKKRGSLAAVYAFQTEILRISSQISGPLLGEIRLQWWQENIITAASKKGLYGSPICRPSKSVEFGAVKQASDKAEEEIHIAAEKLQFPMLAAVGDVIRRHNLPVESFLALCEASRFRLYTESMKNCSALREYCQALYGAVLELSCHILADDVTDSVAAACRAGGMAQGLVMLMQSLPQMLQRNKFYLPMDMVAAVGADREHLTFSSNGGLHTLSPVKNTAYELQAAEQRGKAAQALSAYCKQNYNSFLELQKHIPRVYGIAFLPLAVLPSYMKQAEKEGNNIFIKNLNISHLSQQIKIARAAFFNRF